MYDINLYQLRDYLKYYPRPLPAVVSNIAESSSWTGDYVLNCLRGISTLDIRNADQLKLAIILLDRAIGRLKYIGAVSYSINTHDAALVEELDSTAAYVQLAPSKNRRNGPCICC